jgi:hypothetical protein
MVIIFGKIVNVLVGEFPERLTCPVFLFSSPLISPLNRIVHQNPWCSNIDIRNAQKAYQ